MATPPKRGRGRPPLTEAEKKKRKKKPLRSVKKSERRRNNRCLTSGNLSAHR